MTTRFQIREISAEETIALRWPILRAELARETAIFEGDDAPGTQHFGAFEEGRLAGVATILRAGLPGDAAAREARQLRGMAVAPEVQGQGCGTALVETCVQ